MQYEVREGLGVRNEVGEQGKKVWKVRSAVGSVRSAVGGKNKRFQSK